MKLNKKILPWIPIYGWFVTMKHHPKETGLNNNLVFWITAVIQGLSGAGVILILIHLIFK